MLFATKYLGTLTNKHQNKHYFKDIGQGYCQGKYFCQQMFYF